jgi:hypothetical protein
MNTEALALLAFLALSAMGAGFGAFHAGPFVALSAFWRRWQSAKCANKGPRYFLGMPCRSKKVPKGQKGHACNTRTHGNG